MESPSTSQALYHAIIFPADGRPPHLAELPTSTAGPDYYSYELYSPQVCLVPHPELLMDYVAEGLGPASYQCLRVDALDCMNSKLKQPYAVFYPVVSRDGMPFPVNKCTREIQQGKGLKNGHLWRGDLVVVKFSDSTYTNLISAKMSDFPLIKNWFLTNLSPFKVAIPKSPKDAATARVMARSSRYPDMTRYN